MSEKEDKEILDIINTANLEPDVKDLLDRLLVVVPDFLHNVLDSNYSGDMDLFKIWVDEGTKPAHNIYEEIPNTSQTEDVMASSLSDNKVYFYSDSDNDGKNAKAMFDEFCRVHKITPEISDLADIFIKSPDNLVPNTSNHGLNSNQFIQDFMRNPNEGPITIITADNGCSSQPDVDAITDFCQDRGVKVNFIITDHHLPDPQTKVIPKDNVIVHDLELNDEHGRYTYSGAQTLGELLKRVSIIYQTDEEFSRNKTTTYQSNRLKETIDCLGSRSSVADITNDGSIIEKHKKRLYEQSSSKHNRLRGMDYYLENIPKNSKFYNEAQEIKKVAVNFLNSIDSSLSVMLGNLYNNTKSNPIGGFTAIPHIQSKLMLWEARLELKNLSQEESKIAKKKLEIFDNDILKRLTKLRRDVIDDVKENTSSKIKFRDTELFNYKEVLDPSFSTAFANQIYPPQGLEVSLTTRGVDESTGVMSGSFRSQGMILQELLTDDVISKFESEGLTNPTIKGHGVAAGFKITVDKKVGNPEEIIFKILGDEILRKTKNKIHSQDENSSSEVVPVLQDTQDELRMRKLNDFLGMNGNPNDFEQKFVILNEMDDIVIKQAGKNILISDVMTGAEKMDPGFVVQEKTISGDISIIYIDPQKILNYKKEGKDVYKINGSSQFSTLEVVDEVADNRKYQKVNVSTKFTKLDTKMDNTFSEKMLASDWLNGHPLTPGPEYLNQIKHQLENSDSQSVSELDVEASSLGKAPAMTNLGIITFYISNDTGELMVERNTMLIKTPFPIANSNEELTSITNTHLREKGVDMAVASKKFKDLFKKGKHEIRAFNGAYDLNVLKNNLDSECLDILKSNISFTDTLGVAKSYDVGSLSDNGVIDITDLNGISIIKAVRPQDYENFKNGKLDVLISTKSRKDAEDGNFNYSIRISDIDLELIQKKKSSMSNNNVQSILNALLAKAIYKESPFMYKVISEYNDMEYVRNNIQRISEDTGYSNDEVSSVISAIDSFNDNPTKKQKIIMDLMKLENTSQLFHEKHNNLDIMGDIDLEGVALVEELIHRIKLRYPDVDQNTLQDIINELFEAMKVRSRDMNTRVLYSATTDGDNNNEKIQKELLGTLVDNNTIELINYFGPNKVKKNVNIMFKSKTGELNDSDMDLLKMSVGLYTHGQSNSDEYKVISNELEARGLKFRAYTTVKQMSDSQKKIQKAIDTDKPLTEKVLSNMSNKPMPAEKIKGELEEIQALISPPGRKSVYTDISTALDEAVIPYAKKLNDGERKRLQGSIISKSRSLIHELNLNQTTEPRTKKTTNNQD